MRTLWRSERAQLAAIFFAIALMQRPYIDLNRGDFPVYLQAKSFAELRLDIAVPKDAKEISSDMAFKDGRYYSHYPPGASLLLVPFYWLGHAVDLATGGRLGEHRSGAWTAGRGAYFSAHLANLVWFAVIFVWLRRACEVLELSRRSTVRSAALLVFAAPFLAYFGHVSTQLPSTMLVLVATVAVLEAGGGSCRKLALAGTAGAGAILIRPLNVMFLGLLGVYVLVKCPRRIVGALVFGLPLVIGLLCTLWFNAAMFGDPFENGYVYGIDYGREGTRKAVLVDNRSAFTLPFAEGFLGLTVGAISDDPPVGNRVRTTTLPSWTLPWDRVRGLFLLMPVIVFGLPGFRRWWKEGKKAEAVVLAAHLVILLLVYSKWLFWFSSVHTPLASRYFCEGFPGWCLAIAAYAERAAGWKRTLLLFTTFWSAGVQGLVLLSTYLHYFTGIDLIALEMYKVIGLLAVASSAFCVWALLGLPMESSRAPHSPEA